MTMRDDFCAFILTHGRPDRVHTFKTLQRSGYTGKVYIVIDDEDKTEAEYRKRFGDRVLQFSKREVAEWTDDGDNFGHRKSVIYARNVCWDLAQQVECRYFIQLDDDYTSFWLRFKADGKYCSCRIHKTMDDVLESLTDFAIKSGAYTIAMSQGGDLIGGQQVIDGSLQGAFASLRRKAMNSFICLADRRFSFIGRINEDVTAYTMIGRAGKLFFTVMQSQLVQLQTQTNPGGWTEHYLEVGTYVKSFYSVMYAPSCVQIGVMGDHRSPHYRIHHKINWHHTAPKILREEHRKPIQP